MLMHQNMRALWLLFLLHVSGNAFRLDLIKPKPEPQEGDVRLSGSKRISEGRVEVFHDGQWGTVCDDNFGMAEAQVVCRQLHFYGAESVTRKKYGEVGSGPIWLDDINCNGQEYHLFTCAFKSWGVTDCTHKEDVGVICETQSINGTNTDYIHWLDHSFTLSDGLGQIFDSGNGCDFTISVNSATGNRQEDGTMEMMETTICAHKMILSQFPLFNASGKNTNISVDISEACRPYFTPFIRYLYTRKIDVAFYSAQCLHWMASKFGVKQLTEETGRLLSEVLPHDYSLHTPVSMYNYAEETGDMVLKENCLQYLAWNFEKLTESSAWDDLSVKLLGALLRRSDLLVTSEFSLLLTVERWMKKRNDSISLEDQISLLNHIRFLMIPAEKLNMLVIRSHFYSTFKQMYQEKMLKAFQFNSLLFSNLEFRKGDDFQADYYQPRIYKDRPWSFSFSSGGSFTGSYDYGRLRNPKTTLGQRFSTPIHNSLMSTADRIQWEADVFTQQDECSKRGVTCASLPMARLAPQSSITQRNIHFRNHLVLMCKSIYICQVQEFKDNLAYIASNDTQLAYPCPNNEFSYHFVVAPVYVV